MCSSLLLSLLSFSLLVLLLLPSPVLSLSLFGCSFTSYSCPTTTTTATAAAARAVLAHPELCRHTHAAIGERGSQTGKGRRCPGTAAAETRTCIRTLFSLSLFCSLTLKEHNRPEYQAQSEEGEEGARERESPCIDRNTRVREGPETQFSLCLSPLSLLILHPRDSNFPADPICAALRLRPSSSSDSLLVYV